MLPKKIHPQQKYIFHKHSSNHSTNSQHSPFYSPSSQKPSIAIPKIQRRQLGIKRNSEQIPCIQTLLSPQNHTSNSQQNSFSPLRNVVLNKALSGIEVLGNYRTNQKKEGRANIANTNEIQGEKKRNQKQGDEDRDGNRRGRNDYNSKGVGGSIRKEEGMFDEFRQYTDVALDIQDLIYSPTNSNAHFLFQPFHNTNGKHAQLSNTPPPEFGKKKLNQFHDQNINTNNLILSSAIQKNSSFRHCLISQKSQHAGDVCLSELLEENEKSLKKTNKSCLQNGFIQGQHLPLIQQTSLSPHTTNAEGKPYTSGRKKNRMKFSMTDKRAENFFYKEKHPKNMYELYSYNHQKGLELLARGTKLSDSASNGNMDSTDISKTKKGKNNPASNQKYFNTSIQKHNPNSTISHAQNQEEVHTPSIKKEKPPKSKKKNENLNKNQNKNKNRKKIHPIITIPLQSDNQKGHPKIEIPRLISSNSNEFNRQPLNSKREIISDESLNSNSSRLKNLLYEKNEFLNVSARTYGKMFENAKEKNGNDSKVEKEESNIRTHSPQLGAINHRGKAMKGHYKKIRNKLEQEQMKSTIKQINKLGQNIRKDADPRYIFLVSKSYIPPQTTSHLAMKAYQPQLEMASNLERSKTFYYGKPATVPKKKIQIQDVAIVNHGDLHAMLQERISPKAVHNKICQKNKNILSGLTTQNIENSESLLATTKVDENKAATISVKDKEKNQDHQNQNQDIKIRKLSSPAELKKDINPFEKIDRIVRISPSAGGEDKGLKEADKDLFLKIKPIYSKGKPESRNNLLGMTVMPKISTEADSQIFKSFSKTKSSHPNQLLVNQVATQTLEDDIQVSKKETHSSLDFYHNTSQGAHFQDKRMSRIIKQTNRHRMKLNLSRAKIETESIGSALPLATRICPMVRQLHPKNGNGTGTEESTMKDKSRAGKTKKTKTKNKESKKNITRQKKRKKQIYSPKLGDEEGSIDAWENNADNFMIPLYHEKSDSEEESCTNDDESLDSEYANSEDENDDSGFEQEITISALTPLKIVPFKKPNEEFLETCKIKPELDKKKKKIKKDENINKPNAMTVNIHLGFIQTLNANEVFINSKDSRTPVNFQ